MNDILDGLNEQQKEAVECLAGPVLILAGAGSGKTKTLTHRIANLIAQGTEPNRILAVTFTNKAAKEMRERLWRLLNKNTTQDETEPPRTFMPYMGTFHGISVKILRMEADAAGLDKNFVIYDMDDQVSLIRRAMKSLNLTNNKQLKPKSIQSIISGEKNKGNGPEEYAAKAFYPNQYEIAKIFRAYEEEKQKAGALDFDDLLLRAWELFATKPEVRKRWQNKFRHILIDEYQDTNAIQYQLIKLLINKERNICVVGDDWQSIYSWRGADFTNILNFEKDFPGAKVVKLEQNYRSTGSILEASQKVINHNEKRTSKTLFTEAGAGEPVEIEACTDETKEAEFVARKIDRLMNKYQNYANFAVLYRTNAQSFTFEKVFNLRHIPYKIVGGVRFYDRKEIKDVLSILRLVVNERDKVSLARVASNVLSGIGESSLTKILNAMDRISEREALKNPDLPDVVNTARARNSLMRLANFLKEVHPEDDPGEITKFAINYFDFKTLTDDGTPTGEDRMRNLEVLVSSAGEYANLEDFLADASLMSSADEANGKNSVTLMTIHAAKGLEFDVVFLVGLEEGLFPSLHDMDKLDELEEERRLMYVGMTRARRQLFLTYAGSRYSFGNRSYNMPSRFLTELGYDPYEMKKVGSVDFEEEDFPDPFPDDGLPVWE